MVGRDKHNIKVFYRCAVPLDRFFTGELRMLTGWFDHRHIWVVIGHFRAMRVLISPANSMKRVWLTVFASVPCEIKWIDRGAIPPSPRPRIERMKSKCFILAARWICHN